jgi:twinkle protein
MSGKKIIGDAVCPGCRAEGRDSKGNHLILFEGEDGTRFAKCPKCGHYEKDTSTLTLNAKKEWNQDELSRRLGEISAYPIKDLASRRIPDWVCEHFGVRVGLSTLDGKSIIEHYYPRFNAEMQLCRYNVRVCDPKAFYSIGPNGIPFGANRLDDKGIRRTKLWIFEDELSTMSGFYVLKQFTEGEGKENTFACIGLPAGSGTIVACLQWLIDTKRIERFEEIVYVHDNDKAGFESYQAGRALFAELRGTTTDLKDSNDMLMEGRNKELFKTLVRGARIRSPDGAATIMDAMREAEEVRAEGMTFPWPGLTDLVKLRWGEISALGGGVGGGKTTLVHAIGAHFISQHKVATAFFMLEERISKTLHNVSVQLTGVKSVGFEKDRQQQINETYNLDELMHLWKNKGANDWDNISQCIRYYASIHGVKLFFVDNITALTNTLTPSEINTEIARIATEGAGLADELDIHIMFLSHLNPPHSGPSHEEGGEVRPSQFTGGRGLMRWVQLMLGFERDLYAEGEMKHMSRIRVLKDREDGHTGVITTRYDTETGRLEECQSDFQEPDGDEEERF